MSICIEHNNFNNNIKGFSQDLSINEKSLTVRRTCSSKKNVFEQVRFWIALARQRKHLASLDERMLADIGYSLEQAKVESNKPFWK